MPCLMIVVLTLALQSAGAENILLQGGTLIDGTGKPAQVNANILIEGNVISKVWVGDAGAVPRLPAGTIAIDIRGKFVIPGLIDSHVHYRPYMGELFLAYGVTTVNDLGDPLYWLEATKRGLNSGKIRGPRFYFCGDIGGTDGSTAEENLPTVEKRVLVTMKSPADAKQAVAQVKQSADCIKLREDTKGEYFTALGHEADAQGISIIAHSLDARDSIRWGIDGIEHMVGIGFATMTSPEGKKLFEGKHIEAGHKNSTLYQWMDPSAFDPLIADLLKNNVYINPTLHFEWKGINPRTREHELEDTRLLSNPQLQYVPLDERLVTLGQYHWADEKSSAEKEQYAKGYRRVQEFLSRFVKAGGKIYSGTDSAAATTPGLSMHQEMELLVDAGLTPMQSLMSATLWGAEILRLQDQLGSIEEGKLADLVILDANPLADIRNTKRINRVVQNGEIADTAFHSDYQFPFPRYGGESKHLYNPAPQLRDAQPPVADEGQEVIVRLTGRGFVPSTVVTFAGAPLATRFISATELQITLTPLHTARAGTYSLVVSSPKPGGGETVPVPFIVNFR
ncbi:MAG: hypothetical protein EXQ56_01120 [Acidobacteria bacterium]|nr:hypothetical protein [Acidobacteriota bacterium]